MVPACSGCPWKSYWSEGIQIAVPTNRTISTKYVNLHKTSIIGSEGLWIWCRSLKTYTYEQLWRRGVDWWNDSRDRNLPLDVSWGRCWLVGFHMMVLHHCKQQLALCSGQTQPFSPVCLVMLTVGQNTFLLSLLLCEGFSRFCTSHNSFVKTEIERWKGAEYLMEECAIAGGFALRYLPLYLRNCLF
jgi:hypothetical protein